jgi:hypothetical protein
MTSPNVEKDRIYTGCQSGSAVGAVSILANVERVTSARISLPRRQYLPIPTGTSEEHQSLRTAKIWACY